jgi:hypothetical protein
MPPTRKVRCYCTKCTAISQYGKLVHRNTRAYHRLIYNPQHQQPARDEAHDHEDEDIFVPPNVDMVYEEKKVSGTMALYQGSQYTIQQVIDR